MAHLIQSPEPALTLLAQALPHLADERTSRIDGFKRKMLQMLIEQVHRDDPTAVALPDGRSILVAASKADPELAVAWWRLRGSQAWQPTPQTASPTRDVFKQQLDAYNETLRHYDVFDWKDGCRNSKEKDDFLMDAIKEGILLKAPDVQAWLDGHIEHLGFLKMVEDHTKFVEMCLYASKETSGVDQHKVLKTLLAGDAVMVNAVILDHDDLATRKSFKPTHPFLNRGDIYDPLKKSTNGTLVAPPNLWRPWHATYGNSRYEGEDVLAWLDKEKIDTAVIRLSVLNESVEKTINSCKRDRVHSGRAWTRIQEKFDRLDDWNMEDHGSLVWQDAIARLPSIIPALIANPPPGGLTARSSTGENLWDQMMSVSDNGSKSNLEKLNRALPIHENQPKTPMLMVWHVWNKNTEAMESLFAHSMRKSSDPSPWIGTDVAKQFGLAASVICGLASKHAADRETPDIIMKVLLDDRLDLSAATAFNEIAIPMIQFAAQSIKAGNKGGAITAPSIDEATLARHAKYTARLLARIKKVMKSTELTPHAEAVLSAGLAKISLGSRTRAIKVETDEVPVSRAMRF